MESGRGLSLLRQAHCEGKLDFHDADPFDRNWDKKLQWVTDWIEQENRNRIDELKFQLNCSLMDYLAGEKVMDTHWDQAIMLQRRIIGRLLPWIKLDGERPSADIIRSMTKDWKAIFGDPDDPKVKVEIERTVAHLMNMRNPNVSKMRNG